MANFVVSHVANVLSKLFTIPASFLIHLTGYQSRSTLHSGTYTPGSTPCRYRLDTDNSSTLTLPDQRKLGYAQYGSQAHKGKAIFYAHGLPGSRIEAASWDEIATSLDVRIISVDRPGIGWSSPYPNRTLIDHARDIEQLAKHLKLDEFSVLGVSGGGPYALACAKALPQEMLKAVSIVCGLGPPDMGYGGMNWGNWIGFTFAQRYFPGICSWWMSREPAARLDLSDEERMHRVLRNVEKSKSKMDAREFEVLNDTDLTRLYLRSSREVFAQGMDGFQLDVKVLNNDFGFQIEEMRKDLTVQLCYGKNDTNVPLRHGELIAKRLGNQAQLRVEHATHATISHFWKQQILEEILKAM